MKVLQIIETAYRATIEEQDDTIVWVTHAMKGAGGDLHVLLKGNAVNYTLQNQDASGLRFGDWQQTQPPQLAADIAGLIKKGVSVFAVKEDFIERGLDKENLIDDVQLISKTELPGLFNSYDHIWHW
ncbi:MAG: DsrE family protein [Gammaproteobacteria bacterium]|nr:DsrE family protein [Gammaproteobacteria bacterium]